MARTPPTGREYGTGCDKRAAADDGTEGREYVFFRVETWSDCSTCYPGNIFWFSLFNITSSNESGYIININRKGGVVLVGVLC